MATIQEHLDNLNAAYQEAEGENREEVLATLREIHGQLLDQPEMLQEFYRQAPAVAGGLYIPYIFWCVLRDWLKNRNERAHIQQLIQDFISSDFEETELHHMKPLLVIYLSQEKEFERDRIKAFMVDRAHPAVKDYFAKVYRYLEANKSWVDTFVAKFRLLADAFPNFEYLNIPLNKLKEELA